MQPKINHPARVAERIAVLDLVSRGRVEWGTGEGATTLEMDGFGVDRARKRDAWREATEQAANMLTMSPYPGYEGEFFSFPVRNIVPKSLQKPHPPMWVACSRRETIILAAENGLGALVFGFAEPEMAGKWVEEYYSIIKSDRCVPLGHSVNANLAIVTALSVNQDEQVAIDRGAEGFKFFGFSLGYYAGFGDHQPGVSSVWDQFVPAIPSIENNPGTGGIGTPEQVYQHCKAYQDVGVDQMIFVQQCGRNSHENIVESLELFAAECMPRLNENEAAKLAAKEAELAPYIEAALARKPRMKALSPEEVPVFKSVATQRKETGAPPMPNNRSDRGGGLAVVPQNPTKVD
jgi:alkanesulfonate monooxygenase SsuD/methylene tetrahydromethanopterin reductase-like flavin-dependent oxidoreductase (luciferase family)